MYAKFGIVVRVIGVHARRERYIKARRWESNRKDNRLVDIVVPCGRGFKTPLQNQAIGQPTPAVCGFVAAGRHIRQVVRIEQPFAVIAQLAVVSHGQVFAAPFVVKIRIYVVRADLKPLIGGKVGHAVGHECAALKGGGGGKGFVAADVLVAAGFDRAGGRAFRRHRLVIRGFDRLAGGHGGAAVAVNRIGFGHGGGNGARHQLQLVFKPQRAVAQLLGLPVVDTVRAAHHGVGGLQLVNARFPAGGFLQVCHLCGPSRKLSVAYRLPVVAQGGRLKIQRVQDAARRGEGGQRFAQQPCLVLGHRLAQYHAVMRPLPAVAVPVDAAAPYLAVVGFVAHVLNQRDFAKAQPTHNFTDGPRRAFVAVQLVGTLNQLAPRVVRFGQPVAVLVQNAAAFGQQFQMFRGDQIHQPRHQFGQGGQLGPQPQIRQNAVALVAFDDVGIGQFHGLSVLPFRRHRNAYGGAFCPLVRFDHRQGRGGQADVVHPRHFQAACHVQRHDVAAQFGAFVGFPRRPCGFGGSFDLHRVCTRKQREFRVQRVFQHFGRAHDNGVAQRAAFFAGQGSLHLSYQFGGRRTGFGQQRYRHRAAHRIAVRVRVVGHMHIRHRGRCGTRPVLVRAHAARHAEALKRQQDALAVGGVAFDVRAAARDGDVGRRDAVRTRQRRLQRVNLPDSPAVAFGAGFAAFGNQRDFRLPRRELPCLHRGKQRFAGGHQRAGGDIDLGGKALAGKTDGAAGGRCLQARRVHVVAA
nr:MAG TPA: hypothetical protein [Caudoviricetes sp.]